MTLPKNKIQKRPDYNIKKQDTLNQQYPILREVFQYYELAILFYTTANNLNTNKHIGCHDFIWILPDCTSSFMFTLKLSPQEYY